MYAIKTSSTVFVFNSDTVIKLEVNKQMNVNANLFPFDVVGQLSNGIHCTISIMALVVSEDASALHINLVW